MKEQRRPKSKLIRAGRFALPLGLLAFHLGAASAARAPPPRARDDTSLSYLGRVVSAFPLSEGSAIYYLALPESAASYDEPTRAELRKRLGEIVPRSNPNLFPASVETESEAIAVARKKRKPLVKMSVAVEGNYATIELVELSFARLFWQRVKAPTGTIVTSEKIRVPVDASLFAGKKNGPLSTKEALPLPLTDTIAVDCTLFSGETEPRITLLGRRRILSGHLLGSGFATVAEKNLDSLSPLAGAPLRQALGAIRSDGEKFVVGSSDRESVLVLTPLLEKIRTLPRGYPRSTEECSNFLEDGISPLLRSCATGADTTLPSPERRFQIEVELAPSAPSPLARKVFVTQSSRSDSLWIEGARSPLDLSPAKLAPDSALVGAATLERDDPFLFFRDGESGKLVALTLDGKRASWSESVPDAVRVVAECPSDGVGKSRAVAVGAKGISWIR